MVLATVIFFILAILTILFIVLTIINIINDGDVGGALAVFFVICGILTIASFITPYSTNVFF